VIPRTFPPAPGWSADGHRIKVPLEYGRGPEQVWVYGALRVGEVGVPTRTAVLALRGGREAALDRAQGATPGIGDAPQKTSEQ
jgi:hypothetical protein